MRRLARHWTLIGLLVVILLALVLVALARPTVGWAPSQDEPPASSPEPSQRSEPKPEPSPNPEPLPEPKPAKSVRSDPATFDTRPIRHASEVEAELVDVDASTGNGVESVTFRFAHGTELPRYTVAYTDAIRLYPDEDPIPVQGDAYLNVTFDRTDPNQANRLAFPPSIQVGQARIAEVLLYDNLSGRLRFAVGVNEQAKFRVRTLPDPLRMVVQVEAPR